MGATVTITHGTTGGGWDPETGPLPETPNLTYQGRAALSYDPKQLAQADAADQPITIRTVLVSLPRSAAPQTPGARVHVDFVDANSPASLVDRTLTIQADSPTSEGFDVTYVALDDQTNQGA